MRSEKLHWQTTAVVREALQAQEWETWFRPHDEDGARGQMKGRDTLGNSVCTRQADNGASWHRGGLEMGLKVVSCRGAFATCGEILQTTASW
jgi:hypothetical protein